MGHFHHNPLKRTRFDSILVRLDIETQETEAALKQGRCFDSILVRLDIETAARRRYPKSIAFKCFDSILVRLDIETANDNYR